MINKFCDRNNCDYLHRLAWGITKSNMNIDQISYGYKSAVPMDVYHGLRLKFTRWSDEPQEKWDMFVIQGKFYVSQTFWLLDQVFINFQSIFLSDKS